MYETQAENMNQSIKETKKEIKELKHLENNTSLTLIRKTHQIVFRRKEKRLKAVTNFVSIVLAIGLAPLYSIYSILGNHSYLLSSIVILIRGTLFFGQLYYFTTLYL